MRRRQATIIITIMIIIIRYIISIITISHGAAAGDVAGIAADFAGHRGAVNANTRMGSFATIINIFSNVFFPRSRPGGSRL